MARVMLSGKDFSLSKEIDEEYAKKLFNDIITSMVEKKPDYVGIKNFMQEVKQRNNEFDWHLPIFKLEHEFKNRHKRQHFTRKQLKALKNFAYFNPTVSYSDIAKRVGTSVSYVSRILISKGVRRKSEHRDKRQLKTVENNGTSYFNPADNIEGINHPEFRRPEYLRKVIFSGTVPNLFTVADVKKAIFGSIIIKGMGKPVSPYYKGYVAFNSAYSNLIKSLIKEQKVKFIETTAHKRVKVYAKLPNTDNTNFIEVKGSRVDPYATFNGLKECLNKGAIEWKEDANRFGFDAMGKMPQNEWITFLCGVAKCIKEIDPKVKAKLNLNIARLCFER